MKRDFGKKFLEKGFCPEGFLKDRLISGYKMVLGTLYAPGHYYERVRTFLREYPPPRRQGFRFRADYFGAFFRSIVVLGIVGKERFHYWRLLLWTAASRPRLLTQAVTLAIYGFDFRQVFRRHEKRLKAARV